MTKKTIHNAITGEIKEVDMSPEEEQYVVEKIERKKNEIAEHDAKIEAIATLKASAKAKLIAGEALTAEEADTIVL
tara:strand:+ start:498 stop:725 length:228 start_codon:yes stop_codon:yes gene_type:complete